jgi:hypothetical protein
MAKNTIDGDATHGTQCRDCTGNQRSKPDLNRCVNLGTIWTYLRADFIVAFRIASTGPPDIRSMDLTRLISDYGALDKLGVFVLKASRPEDLRETILSCSGDQLQPCLDLFHKVCTLPT